MEENEVVEAIFTHASEGIIITKELGEILQLNIYTEKFNWASNSQKIALNHIRNITVKSEIGIRSNFTLSLTKNQLLN